MRFQERSEFNRRVDKLEEILNSEEEIPSDIFSFDTQQLVLPKTLSILKNPTQIALTVVQDAAAYSIATSVVIGTTVELLGRIPGL